MRQLQSRCIAQGDDSCPSYSRRPHFVHILYLYVKVEDSFCTGKLFGRIVRQCNSLMRLLRSGEIGSPRPDGRKAPGSAASFEQAAGSQLLKGELAETPSSKQQRSTGGRIFSIVSNTLLAAFLSGGAFLSYYQLRYDCSEVERLVEHAQQQSASGPAQQVCLLYGSAKPPARPYICCPTFR